MSLYEQLREILSENGVLPDDPNDAIFGSELIEKIRSRVKDYSDNSVRQTFSALAGDPTSPLAKVTHGIGYYRRPSAGSPGSDRSDDSEAGAAGESEAGRGGQPEEKFRAFFMRHAWLRSSFPVKVEHTAGAQQPAGVNKWKFPDVVVLDWEVGDQDEDAFILDRSLLEVKRRLGQQPFRLSSVELKVELTLGNFREYFFQCVSNSKWAHVAHLALATPVSDSLLESELRRLGASYGVAISHFPFTRKELEDLPPAQKLLKMSEDEFEKPASGRSPTSIATGTPRTELDWDHIRDMRAQSPEFRDIFNWIARCLRDSRAYTFSNFQSLLQIEGEAG
jgi:hypothetical protein